MGTAVTIPPHKLFLEFAREIGASNVIADTASRVAAQTATFNTRQTIPLILRPANREEVQACVRIAGRTGLSLYPISSGKNWGYGSRVPVADGCALLDLGRMNKIVDFHEERAYVTVEPGVNRQDLRNFLRRRKSKLWMDATGSSPECSLIGNVAERGFGHTPYGDHFSQVCELEVVLANGDCIETGFGRFPNATAAPLYRWGVGPYLDGLFSQSKFRHYHPHDNLADATAGILPGILLSLRDSRRSVARSTSETITRCCRECRIIPGRRLRARHPCSRT